RQKTQLPALSSAKLGDVEAEVRCDKYADQVRGGLNGYRRTQGQPQIELVALIVAAPQMQVERTAELQRRFQVRHAIARRVVAYRCRGVHAQIELDPVLVEETRARTVLVGLQDHATVDEVGHRHGIGVRG